MPVAHFDVSTPNERRMASAIFASWTSNSFGGLASLLCSEENMFWSSVAMEFRGKACVIPERV